MLWKSIAGSGTVTAAAVVGVLFGFSSAMAQVSTPAAGPIPVDAADCQVEPRGVDTLLDLWYQPSGTPAPVAEQQSATGGQPADAETVEAIMATVREWYACAGAGDFLRQTALMTDNAARMFGPHGEVPREDVRAFLEATPQAPPSEERGILLAIRDVRTLPDGRVSAVVIEDDREDPRVEEPSLILFERAGGRYLIAEVLEDVTGSAASP